RSIKQAVDLNGPKSSKVIGFTSSLPNEGKSTIAAALANLAAHEKARCILVDCDLRNPGLSRALSPRADFGILEVILGEVRLEDGIWVEESTKLAFLPAVIKFPLADSNEIMSSDALMALIKTLRDQYDYVILDLPPLAPIVDVRATTHLVDYYVYIVEWG